METYKFEIMVTPNFHDNKKNPYFWAILQYVGDRWVNTGYCDWAKTPIEAFLKANTAYAQISECN